MIIESEIKNFKETQDRETFSLLERLVEIEKVLEAKEEKQDPSLESYQSSVNDDLLKITAGLQHDINQIRSNVVTSGDGVIYSSGQAYYDLLVESKVGEKKGHSRAQLKLTAQELIKIEEEESNESNRKIYQNVLDYANQDGNSLFLPDFREEDLLRRLQELKIARENDKHVISSMSDPMTTKLAFNFDQTKEIYNGGEVKDRYDGPNGSGKIQMLKMTFNDTFSTAKRHLKMWHLGGQKVAHFAVKRRVYSIMKIEDLQKRRDELLNNEITNNGTMYEVEFLCWSEQAIPTSLEVSHIHGNSMDINPRNTNPEQSTDNKERRTHSYCKCNCEEKGLKRCRQSCKNRGCKKCD